MTSSSQVKDLEDRWKDIQLEEEENEEVYYDENTGGDDDEQAIDTRWCLVGRLLTGKISDFWLFQNIMVNLWKPRKGMYIKQLDQNRFLFQFYHEVDVQRVITGSPWTYDQKHFFESDPNSFVGVWREYLRVCVSLSLKKPLKRRMKFRHSQRFCPRLFDTPPSSLVKPYGIGMKATPRRHRQPIQDGEVKQVLFQIYPNKAPGPDGMGPSFYQTHWNIVEQFESNGIVRGIRVANRAPSITHVLFANDNYLFCQATQGAAANLLNLLHSFENASGKKVNVSKSKIFFSPNTDPLLREHICNTIGMMEASEGSHYLGLPNIIDRNKNAILGFLKNKLINRLNSWHDKFLSRASKEILLKTVIQSLPTYSMRVFLILIGTCQEIEKLIARFWWKTSASKGSWDQDLVCDMFNSRDASLILGLPLSITDEGDCMY
uniref:DUF4283 domain-containing protein n=1 Tax=Cannabis sativa TaxID=3483 RepID=A0A803QDQ2_CANSA